MVTHAVLAKGTTTVAVDGQNGTVEGRWSHWWRCRVRACTRVGERWHKMVGRKEGEATTAPR